MFWGISALQMEYNNSAYVLPRATVMLYCFTCGWNVNLLLYKINACMEGVTCLLRLVFILLNSCLFFFGIGILTKMELWAMSYAWYQNFICSKFQNAILLQFAFLNFFLQGCVTSAPKHSRAVIPIKIVCHDKLIENEKDMEDFQLLKSLWRNAVESAKIFSPNTAKYHHNLVLLIREALRCHSHIFTYSEKTFLGMLSIIIVDVILKYNLPFSLQVFLKFIYFLFVFLERNLDLSFRWQFEALRPSLYAKR